MGENAGWNPAWDLLSGHHWKPSPGGLRLAAAYSQPSPGQAIYCYRPVPARWQPCQSFQYAVVHWHEPSDLNSVSKCLPLLDLGTHFFPHGCKPLIQRLSSHSKQEVSAVVLSARHSAEWFSRWNLAGWPHRDPWAATSNNNRSNPGP